MNGFTGAEAAKQAGYGVVKQRSPRKLIETPELKARMQESLIRRRVTLDRIADTVSNSLNANVVAVTKDGVKESAIPDHKARIKAAETASKLWGIGEAVRGGGESSSITLTLSGALAERFAEHLAGTPIVINEIEGK